MPDHSGKRVAYQPLSQWVTVRLGRRVYAWVIRRFTPLGGALYFISFFYAEFVMQAGPTAPAHLAPFLVLALFLVSMTIGWLLRPRLTVSREMADTVTAGDSLTVTYRLDARTRYTAWDLTCDHLPLSPGLAWPEGYASLDELPGGSQAQVHAPLRATQRGRYILPPPIADSAFPFGLWRWGCHGQDPQPLTVHPRFTPLDELDMSFGARYQPGGVAFSSHVGGTTEFMSCREYRYGDEMRNLHWRSWARAGKPIVKEFREEYLSRTALILDTHRPHRRWKQVGNKDALFEAAVSLTAAVADYLSRTECLVELFAAGPQVYRFETGRSLAYLRDILNVLSCLDPHPGEPMDVLRAEVESERMRLSSAVLVLLVWNEARAALVRALAEAGVRMTILLVSPNGRTPRDLPETVRVLSAQDISEGRCVQL